MSNLQIGPRWQKLFYQAFIRNSAAEATGDNPACSLPCNLLRRFSPRTNFELNLKITKFLFIKLSFEALRGGDR